jgi:putative lipoic acid-binding regulatory protein
MGKILLLTSTLLLAKALGFAPEAASLQRCSPLNMAPPEGPAGSFFHQVPDDDDKDKIDVPEDVDDAFSELLKKRKKPSRASNPSTIDGVPTSSATGFGKAKPTKSSKPYVAIGPKGIEPEKPSNDPPINDPTKPEFDDQGYTLYTDKETGEKARVFEALLDYPCEFTMKIVGANEGSFVSEIVALVAEACGTESENLKHTTRSVGKWTSVSCICPVKSSEMLYSLYEKVDLDPRVKFKF